MPVSSFAIGAKFRLTIVKYHQLNPLDKWSNTYEFDAMSAGGVAELNTCAMAFVAFEAAISFDTTIFDHYVFATWEPDSAPYDPENFISQALGMTGGVAAAAAPMALVTTLHVIRMPGFGRSGHLFYRNVLTEADVSAPGGINVLTDIVSKNATIQTELTDANVFDFMGIVNPDTLRNVMIDAAGVSVRPVISFAVAGVSSVKSDHKWYNRTGAP